MESTVSGSILKSRTAEKCGSTALHRIHQKHRISRVCSADLARLVNLPPPRNASHILQLGSAKIQSAGCPAGNVRDRIRSISCVKRTTQRKSPAVSNAHEPSPRSARPAPRDYYRRATELGFEAVENQTSEQMRWLGAEPAADMWKLPVLDDMFVVDLAARRVATSAGEEVQPSWRILALHYLAISAQPDRVEPEITFADLPESRSYNDVYQGRVIGRLCATAGREAERINTAAATIGGRVVEGGDAAFDFDIFPRVTIRLIWHAPDDEFPASATILLPRNIESYFPAEDVVVLSECLVARLGGRPF